MHVDQRHQAPAPARLLVAVDSGSDPHRLVRLCSEHPQADGLSVSLLVPVDIESSPSLASPGHAEEMLRAATRLLDWAGIRVEDITLTDQDPDLVEEIVRFGDFDSLVVCSAHSDSSPVVGLAIDLARRHGLAVEGDGRSAGGAAKWIRSAAGVLLNRSTPHGGQRLDELGRGSWPEASSVGIGGRCNPMAVRPVAPTGFPGRA